MFLVSGLSFPKDADHRVCSALADFSERHCTKRVSSVSVCVEALGALQLTLNWMAVSVVVAIDAERTTFLNNERTNAVLRHVWSHRRA